MIVGIDIGGTKTHVLIEDEGLVLLDRSVLSSDWQYGGLLDDEANAERLLALLETVEGASDAPLVIGAHGLDSDWQTLEFNARVALRHGGPARAVNDVELLGPAAGFDDAIAVIVGTGSKIVAHRADGELLTAGGHGFLLSDPGSAPALAREAVRAVLAAHDDGAEPDPLALLLMRHFGVDDVVALSYAFTTRPQLTVWGELAPLVFAAADAGSALAASVVDDAAKELAAGVG
ncbi:MAG TPA: BadF/BadG/BcrA/BcrD ATPase family protein, partial [Diaminobutyricibacter sp.]